MKVIIVDDDEALAHLLKLSLRVAFYAKAKSLAKENQKLTESLDIEHFQDQRAALHYLEQCPGKVDLIFVETDTPGMERYAFLEACRERFRSKYGEIIILTERGHKQDVKKGIMAGAKDYITKPFGPEELMEHVFNAWSKPRTDPPESDDTPDAS